MARRVTWKCGKGDRRRKCRRSRHPGEESSAKVWNQAEPRGRGHAELNVWDAFEASDEMAEPEPEYGDFWLEPDQMEDVC